MNSREISILSRILEALDFVKDPPILLDIGASGTLHEKWREIAKYSVCIAFDADDRDIDFVERETKRYRKLYVFNRVVTDSETDHLDFFLTRSPYCSSSLRPDFQQIQHWDFAALFEVQKVVQLKSITLKDVLTGLGIKRVDWFKTDSQGTDLRLFKSLEQQIQMNTLVAEFEPGIIDVYRGEDKLHHLMRYMDEMPFWMSDIHVLGCKRINQDILQRLNEVEKKGLQTVRTSPGWAEIIYMNTFRNPNFGKREFLLGCVFAMIEKQYSFALELSINGYDKFGDGVFAEIKDCILRQLGAKSEMMHSEQREVITFRRKLNRALFRRGLRRMADVMKFSKLSCGKKKTKNCLRDVELEGEKDISVANTPYLLRAESRGYREAQYKFWGKRGDGLEVLREWDVDNVLLLSEEQKTYDGYGVQVRTGKAGQWQDEAWVKIEVVRTKKG